MKTLPSIIAALIFFAQTLSAQTTGTIVGTYTAPCTNDGAISVTVTGLTPPISYNYNAGNQYLMHQNVMSTTDNLTGLTGNLGVTIWSVYATDNFKNGAYISFTVQPKFTGSISVSTVTCPNPNTVQIVGLTGGTAPYTFTWTNIFTSQTYSTNPANVSDGQYRLKVGDASGCVATSDSIWVSAISPVHPTVITTNANCTNGTASVMTTGGITPYTYQWHNNASTSSISGLLKGQVTVAVTDAQGCIGAAWGNVLQGVTINYNSTINNATCLQNNGSIMSFVTGGTAPYTYLWSNGATTASVSNLVAGSYKVLVTDANNCTGESWEYVQASTPINVTYTSTPSSCTAPTGGATLNATGGQAPYTIVWNTFPSPTSGISISGKPAGNYAFDVTDANGCVQHGAILIPSVSTLNASLNASSVICPATTGNITSNVTGSNPPFTYNWSNSTTASSITNAPLGAYSCTITDNVGCKVQKYASLYQSSPMALGVVSAPVNCLYAANGSATAIATGGVGPYTYTWSNNQTGATASGLAIGYYNVTATAANGCTGNKNFYIGNSASSNACYCTITGTVYTDTNNDCVRNSGETGIPNIQIHCSNFGYAYTNSNGVYSFQVPTGAYTVSESVQMIYPLASCQANNQTVSVVAGANCTTTVNFANNVVPISDLHIITTHNIPPIPGNNYSQRVIVQNEGTLTESTIKLGYTHDGQLPFSSATPWAMTQQNSTSYPNWYSVAAGFPTLAPSGTTSAFVNYNVPTNIPINTVIQFKDTAAKNNPIATTWLTDNTPWNNVDQFPAVVVSSYDPNFKEVSPAGAGPAGVITVNDSILTYIVHFQNEGTWYAQNVVVVDTLDKNLNVSTLRPGYSDHKYVATIDKNNVLKFTFSNINLPYKSAFGDLLSSGMFVYSIRLKSKLPGGSKIYNKAAIYFDYNAPIITNRVVNTITSPDGINDQIRTSKARVLTVYPNPSRGEFNVGFQNHDNSPGTLSVFDISGRIVLSEDVQLSEGYNNIQINKNNLTSGIYFVQLKRGESVSVEKVVISK